MKMELVVLVIMVDESLQVFIQKLMFQHLRQLLLFYMRVENLVVAFMTPEIVDTFPRSGSSGLLA